MGYSWIDIQHAMLCTDFLWNITVWDLFSSVESAFFHETVFRTETTIPQTTIIFVLLVFQKFAASAKKNFFFSLLFSLKKKEISTHENICRGLKSFFYDTFLFASSLVFFGGFKQCGGVYLCVCSVAYWMPI